MTATKATKTCSQCGKTKDLAEFRQRKRQCRLCRNFNRGELLRAAGKRPPLAKHGPSSAELRRAEAREAAVIAEACAQLRRATLEVMPAG